MVVFKKWHITVWGLQKWGHLKNVITNIAQRLIEVQMLIYFLQPPFWQAFVNGCPIVC
jgi:hypothetical protein